MRERRGRVARRDRIFYALRARAVRREFPIEPTTHSPSQESAPPHGPRGSGRSKGPAGRAALGAFAAVALLIAGFGVLAWQRIPVEQLLRYDEATHVFEGMQIRDALVNDGPAAVARLFLDSMTMKGILYRVYFGLAFLDGTVSPDRARQAGLIACLLALAFMAWLARELAPRGRRDVAGFAAVAFAVGSPLLAYWGRSAMVEPLNLLALLAALHCVVRDRRIESGASGALAATALVLAIFTKYNHALILIAACGLDGLIEGIRRVRAGATLRRGARPLVPLAVACLFLAAWLADAERLKAFWYYIVTIPGNPDDPVNAGGTVYLGVLATRLAPGVVGSVLLASALVAGLRGALAPRVRLVVLHLSIGLVLAQLNDLKLERILMPLVGDVYVIAGLGAASLLGALSRRAGRRAAAVAGIIALGAHFAFARGFFAIERQPLRQLDAVIDAGLDLMPAQGRVLWVGQGFFQGRGPRITAAHVVIRARERGTELERKRFEYMSGELAFRLGFDPEGRDADTVDPQRLFEFGRQFLAVIVVYDAIAGKPPGPVIINPVDRRIARMVEQNPLFQREKSVSIPVVDLEKPGSVSQVVVSLYTRRP